MELRNQEFLGCVAKELGISGDAAGVHGFFWLPIARLHGIFPREDPGFKEFRGFPDMELGIFRVAKILRWGPSSHTHTPRVARVVSHDCPKWV